MSYRAGEPVTVLVVDDDEANRNLACDVLAWAGFRVLQAEDGATALTTFRRERPDFVVLDLRMPGLDGLEVLRHIRESAPPYLASTPVIVTTALAFPVDADRAMEAGANALLVEPYPLRTLCATVRGLVGQRVALELGD